MIKIMYAGIQKFGVSKSFFFLCIQQDTLN